MPGLTVWYNTRCPVCDAGIGDQKRRLIALWRMTPGEKWLAALMGNRLVLPLSRFAYDRFADLLYAWNRRNGRW